MNYAGKSGAAHFSDSLGATAHDHVRFDAPPAHAPAGAVVVPDAHFLFNADFKRSGVDLILSVEAATWSCPTISRARSGPRSRLPTARI